MNIHKQLGRLAGGVALAMQIFCAETTTAQGYLKADGKRIVNEKGDNVLLRGFGLGGWMLQEGYMLGVYSEGQQYRIRERIEELTSKKQADEFYDAWLNNHTTKADIDSLKAWGYNSVRLPMHYNLYTLPVDKEPVAGQNTWLDKGFAMTDSLLAWCKANQMYLILDLHAAPGGQGNDLNIADRDPSKPSLWESPANQAKMIALWRKLAERYVNEPWIGAYDIINEPNWGFTDLQKDKNGTGEQNNAPLRKLMMEVIAAIREVDKKHMVIIEGNGWGNNYNGVLPPWDDNMVLSFHKYWNFNDDASIKHIIDYRDKYNIPVWLGETGENSNVWFTDAIHLLEKNNIGWAWWPLKKLGNNNPLQVRNNPAYEQVQRYWRNEGPKPDAATAYKGLMELANATHIKSNIVHHDVIDAMIRQPSTNQTKAFAANRLNKSLIIDATGYDFGRNGYAYFDTDTANYHVTTGKRTAGNRGNIYRNDGVDIQKAEKADTYFVSDIEDGEWLQYTINVSAKGNYNICVLASAEKDGGKVSILNGAETLVKDIAVPSTGNTEKWQLLKLGKISLNKGENKLRILAAKGGFNLAQVQLSK